MEDFLSQLNDSQCQAVKFIDGPSLVIAGAGSGKTRVLTYKIAYLLTKGYVPGSIMALTFTNKAAREMKERVGKLTDSSVSARLWMGTFHSIFSRILRREAEHIGYSSNFTIYDSADSKSLLRSIIKEMGLDDKVYRLGMVQSRISNAKNALITAEGYRQSKELMEIDFATKTPLIADIYLRYQNRCKQADAMDFDDLLLQTNVLFRDYPDVLRKYSEHFKYILVDEYQDTNFAQHLIVKRLCEVHNRLCVVGDDAQSIYSFRGAKIDNILQFKSQFEGCRIFKLEQNYRSTQNIVNAANSLIFKNSRQIKKNVFSEKEEGNKVYLFSTYSDYEEAYAVASKIESMKHSGNDYSDFAVLYRTNAQSRVLEEALRKRSIPYKIYGGLSFYQRKEVKDLISYLRLIINPNDEEAFKRIINYPARGIGDTTLKKIVACAMDYGVSLWTVISEPAAYSLGVNKGTLAKLDGFREMMERFVEYNVSANAFEVTKMVAEESTILSALAADKSVEGVSQFENIQELLKGISEFCDSKREEGGDEASLADFLSEVSLLTDQDNDKNEFANKVTLMTIHAAKGLEFPNVFIVGMEEDLFPSGMSKDNIGAIEEERRLFYVAITRAEKNCFLSYAKSRFRNGQSALCSPSRFLKDIDASYIKMSDDVRLPNRESSFYERSESIMRERREASSEPHRFEQPKVQTRLKPIDSYSQASQSSPKTSAGDLKIGSLVSHDRFGKGVVVSIEGDFPNTKATVDFENIGQKQLLLKFAKLTVLG